MSWYRMERGWQDNDVFSNEPYTEREAWEWFIGAAAWEPTTININGNPFKLEIGQFSHSLRFIATKFNWKKDKVSRLIKKFERFNMIATANATGQQVITICNYTKYQGKRDTTATANATEARHDRDKDKEYNNIINTADDSAQDFEEEITERNYVTLGKQISKITGWDLNPNWTGNYSRVQNWLANGWCPERDIIPTIKMIMQRKRGDPPSGFNYFEKPIADAYAARNKPLPEGNHENITTNYSAANRKPTSEERSEQQRIEALRELGVEDCCV